MSSTLRKQIWFTIFTVALVAALLLSGCGAATGNDTAGSAAEVLSITAPTPTATPESTPADAPLALAMPYDGMDFSVNEPTGAANEIVVSTVDEFLSAIGPDRTIYLNPGAYALDASKDYGKTGGSQYYSWQECYDGYELHIQDIENLSIIGHSANDVSIQTTPRHVNVIALKDCDNITVRGITAGHTKGAGSCAGAVLYFDDTETVNVSDALLYGCGTRGVEAFSCEDITLQNCVITECSQGAILVERSRNVLAQNCHMTNCGTWAAPAISLVSVSQSDAVAVTGTEISGNVCQTLLESGYSQNMYLLHSSISNNFFTSAVVFALQISPVVEGCAFIDNEVAAWYPTDQAEAGREPVKAVSLAGAALGEKEFLQMQLKEVPYERPAPTAKAEKPLSDGSMRDVHVSTVDELLAAIGSNTTVHLKDGVYDLSKAKNYGQLGTDAYYWRDVYDGPGLFISGVSNFHMVGGGADKVSITAIPRYADVLTYESCENVSITGATLGHSQAPGECCGGVLRYTLSKNILVKDCGLFGCGILGVYGESSDDITVEGTEIYDCSQGAAHLYECDNVNFTDCNVHDCGTPLFVASGCKNALVDGKQIQ